MRLGIYLSRIIAYLLTPIAWMTHTRLRGWDTNNRSTGRATWRMACMCSTVKERRMFRKRNLIAMLMAAMLSLGTLGVAFADGDSGSDYVPVPNTIEQQI